MDSTKGKKDDLIWSLGTPINIGTNRKGWRGNVGD